MQIRPPPLPDSLRHGFGSTSASAPQNTPGGREAPGATPAGRFVVSRFAALMNMAAPAGPGPVSGLLAPHGVIALATPGSRGGAVSHPAPARGPTDLAPESLARELLEEIGDGARVSLADAQRALAIPAGLPVRNDPGRIGSAFAQLDRNDDASLDHAELTELMRSYQAQKDADPLRRPTLPPTWA